jgi:hypothetical protein
MISPRIFRKLILATGFGAILCGTPAWAAPETALAAEPESVLMLRAPKSSATAAVAQTRHASRRPAYTRVAEGRYYPPCPEHWYPVQMPLIVGIAY